MAVGEAACVSVHGANRLGSNSLIDLTVFGRAAALRCAAVLTPGERQPEPKAVLSDPHLARFDRLRHASGDRPTASLRNEMQTVMQAHAAVFRTGEVLAKGMALMRGVHAARADLRVADRGLVWNTDLMETLEFDNLVGQAMVTMRSAYERQESRGAHAREDFPARDDETWMKHTLAWLDEAGDVAIGYRPVHAYTLTNEVAYIPPKARTY